MSFRLRPHQTMMRSLLGNSVADGHRSPILGAPTGIGKTHLITSIAHGAIDKPKRLPDGTTRPQRVGITVPFVSLIDQTLERLGDAGLRDIGVIQADHPQSNPRAPVQLCSVQTLARRKLKPDFDILLVDEAHIRSKFLDEWIPELRAAGKLVIGFSATPWSKGLAKLYDDLVVGMGMREAIDTGLLCDFRVFNSPSGIKPDLSKVKTLGGDFQEDDLSKVMQDKSLVADAVATKLSLASDRPTLCFAVDRAHALKIQEAYTKAGIACGYIDALTPVLERQKLCMQLKYGRLQVIVNIGTLTTGADLPFVSCIQLCRPTKSPILFTQIIGRGMRVDEGKSDLLILDHSTTTSRLGFPDDVFDEEMDLGLDDGTPTRREKQARKRREKPLECLRCGAVRKPGLKACWSCGFEPKPQSKREFVQGELVEAVRPKKVPMAQKQEFYSQLLWVQQNARKADGKPYNVGWVAHRYRARFGVWPRRMKDIPKVPTAEVLGHIATERSDHRVKLASKSVQKRVHAEVRP